MGINLVTFYNSTVTPQDDALIYENALPGSGMIYGGNVTIKNANTLHVTAGHGALCGRKFTIEETDVPVQLTSSGTLNGRLYIHMDLSNVDEPITLEVERASTLTPPVQQSNVNITDGIFEIDLATFQISTSTISNLVYVAPFIHYEFLKEVIIAPVEKTNVASQNYVVGRHLMLNNILYKVTAAITAGQTIAVGTNVALSDDVEKQIETNLSSINTINGNKLNQTVIATRQANLTASKAYVVGEQFIYNNTLYEVTAAISKNAAITIGGNCKVADNITSQISKLNKSFKPVQTVSFPYTMPADGFVTLRFAIAAQGAYALYVTVNGVLYHPFSGWGGGTNWSCSHTFAARKGDVLNISESTNLGNIFADVILIQ